MPQLYVQNIQTGLFYFLIIGLALLIPVVAFHYVRFGRVDPRRSFVLYATLLYGLVLLALVFMPFPPIDSVCTGRQSTQFVPFQFVSDIQTELVKHNRSGLLAALTSKSMLGFVFNVALFVPLGVLLRRVHGLRRRWVVAIGFGASLLIEIIQVTGNLGIYPCPYRLFDIDDLMANTLGAALGGLIAPAALIVPKLLPAAETRALADSASLPRQVAGYGLDMIAAGLLAIVLYAFTGYEPAFLSFVCYLLVRIVLPVLDQGYTPAGRLLRFKVRRADGGPAPLGRVLLREIFGPAGMLFVLSVLAAVVGAVVIRLHERYDLAAQLGLPERETLILIGLGGLAAFTLLLLAPVFRRDQRAWHDLFAGLRCVLDHPRPTPPAEPDLAGSVHARADAPEGPRSPAL
ncbi:MULTISPECIES: VanZ family protein [unclassified Crossiella]|uniref:VanZ family protein n=1 Tax=unclassified Crossiella TaxID=2620835 RepID=UPI0020002F97|nr:MULTISPECIES: VanZ family protein [unclassified Crossiella]MCK2236309.1 VanZ family protein [Crossiella sp. S99.2]MCK2249976.1 VanZ family protein [Crossiella sp. S99.1]